MTKEIPQKVRVKVLWDAGFRSPGSLKRRGKIPEGSAFCYISEFKNGGYHNRKYYPKRKKPSQAVQVVRKVLKKAKDRKKIRSLRDIEREVGIGKDSVREILKGKGLKFVHYKKRVFINEETRKNKLKLAQRM